MNFTTGLKKTSRMVLAFLCLAIGSYSEAGPNKEPSMLQKVRQAQQKANELKKRGVSNPIVEIQETSRDTMPRPPVHLTHRTPDGRKYIQKGNVRIYLWDGKTR